MKSRKSTSLRKALAVISMLALSSLGLLAASGLAKTAARASGELSFARQVSVNGTGVISGITVFSESRVKTSPVGAATINLNKLGRVGLGPETELTLRFSEGLVGGMLHSGRVVINVPAGVKISLITAEGTAATEGKTASALTVDVTGGQMRVAAGLGSAQVNSGGKVERVEAGQEVSVSARPASQSHRRRAIALGTLGASGGFGALALSSLGSSAHYLGFKSPTASVFPSAGGSRGTDGFGDPPCRDFFGNFGSNAFICRDYFNTHCLAQPSRRGVCNPFF